MQRMHFQRDSRWPAHAPTRAWAATICVLTLAACSDSPLEPPDSTPEAAAPEAAELTAVGALNPSSPTEPFDAFNSGFWYRSTHVLGRGPLMPENVVVSSSQLRLMLDANGYEGAEIGSRTAFGAGSYAARLRCGAPAGALCAFFFYQPGVGDAADEIDIEILGGTREIWFTTWSRGRRTNHAARVLPFDPAVAAHEYAIVRTGSRVSFYVDGQQYASFRKKVPTSQMALLVNAWWPTWLTPAAGSTGSLDVDWIDWS